MLLEWTAVPCARWFEIRHYVNDELHETHIIPSPWNMMHIDKVECSVNNLTITTIPLSEDTHSSGYESKYFEVALYGNETSLIRPIFDRLWC